MLSIFLALLSVSPATALAQVAPLATIAAADPAKVEVATRIVARLIPNGSYRKMSTGLMATIVDQMTTQIIATPVRNFAAMMKIPAENVAKLGPETMREVAAIIDPAFDTRLRLSSEAMYAANVDQMSHFESMMSEGTAIAYANRFSSVELADIERFFKSSSGSVYAMQVAEIPHDPAIMLRIQKSMLSTVDSIPVLAEKARAATASLPPPKKIADLSAADITKLAALLGVEPGAIK
jgi:hypothetical protein